MNICPMCQYEFGEGKTRKKVYIIDMEKSVSLGRLVAKSVEGFGTPSEVIEHYKKIFAKN